MPQRRMTHTSKFAHLIEEIDEDSSENFAALPKIESEENEKEEESSPISISLNQNQINAVPQPKGLIKSPLTKSPDD